MIIGIAGKAGSGKSTVANFLENEYDYSTCGFADPLKAGLNASFGWTMEQWNDRTWKETVQPLLGFSPRQAAQEYGTGFRVALKQPNLWINVLDFTYCTYTDLAIYDVRHPIEQDYIHNRGGKILYINRPNTDTVADHASENSIDFTKVDWMIINDTDFAQLYWFVDDFMLTCCKEKNPRTFRGCDG